MATGAITVLTPPTSARLTTLDAARQQTGAPVTASDDLFLGSLIDRASAVVAQYCGTPFGLRRLQELYHLPVAASYYAGPVYSPAPVTPAYGYWDWSPLILSGYPIVTLETVLEGTAVLPTTSYELDGALYRLQAGQRSYWLPPVVTVTYQCGYVLPGDPGVRSLPYDIEAATLSLIQAGYSNRASNPAIVTEIVEGVGRIQYGRNPTVTNMTIDPSLAVLLSGHVKRVW